MKFLKLLAIAGIVGSAVGALRANKTGKLDRYKKIYKDAYEQAAEKAKEKKQATQRKWHDYQ